MSASLKGSLCIYQGEELALREAEIPFDQLQDPYGITFWPEFKGRDGCRTPMPWRARLKHGGFTSASGQPWLPLASTHLPRAVDAQEQQAGSALNFYREFLRWRKQQAVLRGGDIRFAKVAEPVLAFTRSLGKEAWLCAFNLGDKSARVKLRRKWRHAEPIVGHPLSGGRVGANYLELDPFGGLFARI
jgi:alpha-glucosidase